MSEQKLLFIDIEPRSTSSAPTESRPDKPLWTRTDNTFKFNFLPDNSPTPQEEAAPSPSTDPTESGIPFTGKGSTFAFNFQIPADTPAESMDTAETPDSTSLGSQQEKPSSQQEVNSPSEPSVQSKSKKKKKKKSEKKNTSVSMETQQASGSAEGSQREEETELSAEEQLNRQLDWCIEQLEFGMRSQKGTPKQKEEASRALKTLRSSKAPLAKKRQVMRAMTGDYRKKMDEEKSKQYKLIQKEMASAQVKVVSDPPKKCVFHRKAEVKTQEDSELKGQTQEQTSSTFVLSPSKEEFRFNFF